MRNDKELDQYLRDLWRNPDSRQQQHLTIRNNHTVTLTDNAPDTFGWASGRIAANLTEQSTVLDIGCGGGQYLSYLLQQPSLVKFGIGLDRRNLEAQSNLQKQSELAGMWAFVQGDALNLPFADGSFEVAMANRMLNQTGDIDRALSEVQRVLKPNGKLFIVTADSENSSILRQIHEAHQEQLGFAPHFYTRSSAPGQRFNLENGRHWLSPYFQQIEILPYERVMQFKKLDEAMDLYATGLIFHKVTDHYDGPTVDITLWRLLYRSVEAELSLLLSQQGIIEIRDGATLFIVA